MKILTLIVAATAAFAPAAAAQARPAPRRVARRPRVEQERMPAPLPAHAAAYEFTLPEPPPGAAAADLLDALRSDGARPAAVAGLVRLPLAALRETDLPIDLLRTVVQDPTADAALSDACGLLLACADPPGADRVLHRAVLDRAKRGEDATGCVQGFLMTGGEPAAAWLLKLCRTPGCPAAFTLSALRAVRGCVRDRQTGVPPQVCVRFVTGLLSVEDAAADAADCLAVWRAWTAARTVLDAADAEDDENENRGRAFRIAAARFALSCAADPAAGRDGALCEAWLGEVRATDADLLRRAERTRGR